MRQRAADVQPLTTPEFRRRGLREQQAQSSKAGRFDLQPRRHLEQVGSPNPNDPQPTRGHLSIAPAIGLLFLRTCAKGRKRTFTDPQWEQARAARERIRMHLHIEFFVENLALSRDFYMQILGFAVVRHKSDGFTELSRGAATIALNDQKILHSDHPTRPGPGERIGKGVEVVLIVDSVNDVYDHVLASGWPISTALTEQPWGMTDFRIVDPDGIYIRITAPRAGAADLS